MSDLLTAAAQDKGPKPPITAKKLTLNLSQLGRLMHQKTPSKPELQSRLDASVDIQTGIQKKLISSKTSTNFFHPEGSSKHETRLQSTEAKKTNQAQYTLIPDTHLHQREELALQDILFSQISIKFPNKNPSRLQDQEDKPYISRKVLMGSDFSRLIEMNKKASSTSKAAILPSIFENSNTKNNRPRK